MECAKSPLSLRLVIADDHPIVRTARRKLLECAPGREFIGEAANGADAVEQALALQPDVMLVDRAMPKLNGTEVVRRVTSAWPRTRVLALAALEGPEYVRAAVAAGALGYLPKSAMANDLIGAIHTVAVGKRFVPPSALHGSSATPVAPIPDSAGLSGREGDVIRLVAPGYTSKEIAVQLELSVKTVETYKVRAGAKSAHAAGWNSSVTRWDRDGYRSAPPRPRRPVRNNPDARRLATRRRGNIETR